MEEQKVWVPHPSDGYQLGQIADLAEDGATVQPLDPKRPAVTVPYDRLYPAEQDDNKDVDDNCEYRPTEGEWEGPAGPVKLLGE
ncbi:Unconventional myosin-VI [Amphibalanus amphitrite]|uniref:Unconventional myosin-VI n=1 Tax=Amphibalanus amphitrite TaxID=1232801 RepID=A0A6A4WRQ4_AMPAM|nr:Unconventional myosin-VI [Amphibalanus amphitrite]